VRGYVGNITPSDAIWPSAGEPSYEVRQIFADRGVADWTSRWVIAEMLRTGAFFKNDTLKTQPRSSESITPDEDPTADIQLWAKEIN
jgi:hypothetical protein